jgi:hypothetical protein
VCVACGVCEYVCLFLFLSICRCSLVSLTQGHTGPPENVVFPCLFVCLLVFVVDEMGLTMSVLSYPSLRLLIVAISMTTASFLMGLNLLGVR